MNTKTSPKNNKKSVKYEEKKHQNRSFFISKVTNELGKGLFPGGFVVLNSTTKRFIQIFFPITPADFRDP